MKQYKLLKNGEIYLSDVPGKYAGHRGYKIFGRLSCKSGMRMKKENRIFFFNLEDAVLEGYRPCKLCKPIDESEFNSLSEIMPHKTLEDFYNSGKKFR